MGEFEERGGWSWVFEEREGGVRCLKVGAWKGEKVSCESYGQRVCA